MNRNDKIVLIIAGAKVAVSVAYYLHIRKIEREKRATIQTNFVKEMGAINHAAHAVHQRLDSGRYYPSIDAMMTDLEFEKIAFHEKD